MGAFASENQDSAGALSDMFDWTTLILFTLGSMICVPTFLIGFATGGIIADRRCRTAISVALKAVVRSRKKAWFGPARTFNDCASVPAPQQTLRMLSRTRPATNADPLALAAARHFKESMVDRFGNRLRAVYLYGSRARGDHCDGSDVDVAVILASGAESPKVLKRTLLHEACRQLLTHGLYVQAHAFDEGSLESSDAKRYRMLIHLILREGVLV